MSETELEPETDITETLAIFETFKAAVLGSVLEEPVYGASAVKRIRFTNAQLNALDAAILAYVEQQHPITVRGVFYAMSVQGLVPKDAAGYRRVQRRVLDLRRSGRLPYDRISDSTRWMRRAEVHSSLTAMLGEAQRFYRRDIWTDMPAYVEVWCEKDALAGVIGEATYKWHVPLLVSRGFSSDSYLYECATHLAQQDKPAFVYLFTDHDAAGHGIDVKIREGLKRFSDGADITFRRAALTAEQVRTMALPTREPKPADKSAGFEACAELDAIPPRTLIAMVEGLILQHVDQHVLDRVRRVEAVERETLTNIVRQFSAGAFRGV